MSNSDLENIAKKVISNVEHDPNDKEFGSIIGILMVISLILTLIRVLQECNKSKLRLFDNKTQYAYIKSEVQNLSFKKTWFTKRIIKRAIRREMSKENYNKYGVKLMNAILASGQNITDHESTILMEAANNV